MTFKALCGVVTCVEAKKKEKEKSFRVQGGKNHPAAACLPDPESACLGSVPKDSEEWGRIAAEGARTVPGRENGGNCDIKNLSRGSKVSGGAG